MPKLTRTFTVDELEDIGAPFDLPEGVEVSRALVGSERWTEVWELLFRHDDRVWRITYEVGATEHQDGVEPFRYDPVTATAVEERQVTVTQWLPVETAGDSPSERLLAAVAKVNAGAPPLAMQMVRDIYQYLAHSDDDAARTRETVLRIINGGTQQTEGSTS